MLFVYIVRIDLDLTNKDETKSFNWVCYAIPYI